MQTNQPLSGLAKRLVNEGVCSTEVALEASVQSREKQQTFISYVIEQRLVSAYRAAAAAAEEFGMPLLDLDALEIKNLPKD